MKKRILIIVITALCFLFADAQDFSGTWNLKERTSLTGNDYQNGLAKQITITNKKDSISITRIVANQYGDVTQIEMVSIDGKPNPVITPGKRKKIAVIQWTINNKGFTESGSFSTPEDQNDISYKISETWTISDDGKRVTIVKTYESTKDATDKWSMKGEYEKL